MYKYYNKNYYDEGGVIMPADEQKLWGVWGQANGIYSKADHINREGDYLFRRTAGIFTGNGALCTPDYGK